MTLVDVASRLGELSEEAIIFAERIDGAFVPNSRAGVLTIPEAEQDDNMIDVAARYAPGLAYCLEVCIAKDAVRVWSKWRGGQVASALEAAEAICHKATFDAWAPSKL